MMACGPNCARAMLALLSCMPRWTPSAPMVCANSKSSLMSKGMPVGRHRASSACACSVRNAVLASLLRYCSQTMPFSNGAVCAISRAVSVSSGVIR